MLAVSLLINKFYFNRQFLSSQFKCFFRYTFRNTICFKQNTSWFYYSSPIFRVTFTFTHPHFSWLAGNWFIREYPDPNISFTFHVTGHCLTGTFNLPVC